MSKGLRIMATVLAFVLLVQVSASSASATMTPTVTQVMAHGALRVDKVSDANGQSVHIVSYLDGTLLESQDTPDASSAKEIALKPITDQKKVAELDKRLTAAQTEKPTGRLYFQVFGTEDEALTFAKSLLIDGDISPTWRRNFQFGSFLETYGTSITGGYHVHLSSRDAQYLFGLGGVASATLIGWLAALGVITAGAAAIIGGIVAAALLTLYWQEQNNDGSFDVWIPYASMLLPAGSRPVKVGQHWYAF